MRQSLAQFEAAFREETVDERQRRERLRREAAERARLRRAQRISKRGNHNFIVLVVAILVTSVVVTFAMFQALSLLVGG